MLEFWQTVMVTVMLETFGECNWEGQNRDEAKIEGLIPTAASLVSLNLVSPNLTWNLNQLLYNGYH